MFPTSTQKRFWTFKTETDLIKARELANKKFIQKHGAAMKPKERDDFFMTPSEERIILRHYESQLQDFCRHFQPTQPKCVYATASHYFKRFYLKCSPMDYHPKEILVTCAYLACKVEEFNVSIVQFVSNIHGDREKASTIILSNELLLMQMLNYHLTIHNPFRAVEGLLIDIKTRSKLDDPERLRPYIEDFLDRMFQTDACLMFAPSQIALASVLHAASKIHENLDQYVTETLIEDSSHIVMSNIVEAVRKIRTMVKNMEQLPRDSLKVLVKKLDKCRNQENNPDSLIYKQRMVEDVEEDDPGMLMFKGTQENYMDGFAKITSPRS